MTGSRAIILATNTVISPFGDHVSEAFFTEETLLETQRRAFERIGFTVLMASTPADAIRAIKEGGSSPSFLLLDRIYVSEKAAHDFLKAAKKAKKTGLAALALTINASVRYTLPLQDVVKEGEVVVHDVLLLDASALAPSDENEPDPARFIRAIALRAARILVPKRELVAEVQLPTIGEREKTRMEYPVTSTIVVSIEHWVHILWLNQIAFGIRWMELLRRHPLWAAWRFLTAFSIDRHRLLDRLVWRGRGARVHPTAYLSASIIGKDVTVGAHVTVRNSIVGDGAVLQDHAVLLNTVVGPKTLVTENTFMVSTVCMPGVTVGNYKLQVTLIGRDAYVNLWAGLVDAKFKGDVMVRHKGELVSSGRSFLGSCVGHRAKVAAKILIQPGREIPNDTVIVMRPDEVVSTIPPDLPANTPLVRDHGTLVPLGTEKDAR
jgi:acetyltransferase-like isoleucine patch superfamily enzyme